MPVAHHTPHGPEFVLNSLFIVVSCNLSDGTLTVPEAEKVYIGVQSVSRCIDQLKQSLENLISVVDSDTRAMIGQRLA